MDAAQQREGRVMHLQPMPQDMTPANDAVAAHTPAPWRINGRLFDKWSVDGPCSFGMEFIGARGHKGPVAITVSVYPNPEHASVDAAHIVKCVNAHDELVAALGSLLRSYDGNAINRARAILAKVQS